MRDWDYEFSLMRLEDDARQHPDDVIHGPQPEPREPHGRTFQERHDAFIRDGLCPACKIPYDETGFCSCCGFVLAQDKPLVTVELRDDYVPQLPLPIEEFSPAALDEVA